MGNAMAASQFPYLGAATATSLSVGRDGSDHSSSINFSTVTGIHFFDTSDLKKPSPACPYLHASAVGIQVTPDCSFCKF